MAKTAAERQAIYRERRPHAGNNGERRLNTWVTTGTALALRRLANHYCVTQREILEKLIAEADEKVTSTIDLDSPEWSAYYIVTR